MMSDVKTRRRDESRIQNGKFLVQVSCTRNLVPLNTFTLHKFMVQEVVICILLQAQSRTCCQKHIVKNIAGMRM